MLEKQFFVFHTSKDADQRKKKKTQNKYDNFMKLRMTKEIELNCVNVISSINQLTEHFIYVFKITCLNIIKYQLTARDKKKYCHIRCVYMTRKSNSFSLFLTFCAYLHLTQPKLCNIKSKSRISRALAVLLFCIFILLLLYTKNYAF